MEIAEFLLARITEDAAAVPLEYASEDYGSGFNADPIAFEVSPRRWLAECDAKRRLIRACTHEVENWVTVRPGVRQNMPVRVPWGDDDLYADALRFLALPYADHRDYEKEWAPV